MTINGWDISEAGARQWNVTFGSCDIDTNTDWIEGSAIPLLFRNHTYFKELTITLMLKGKSRQELLAARSDILANLLEPAVLVLDNYPHSFLGVLKKISDPNEEAMQRFHTLRFTFDCTEFGDCVYYEMDGMSSLVIDNPGNIITPLIVEITPYADVDNYVLNGICRKLSIMGRSIEEERNESNTAVIVSTDNKTETDTLGSIPKSGGDVYHDLFIVSSSEEYFLPEDETPLEIQERHDADATPILGSTTTWRNDYAVNATLKAGDKITLNGETGIFVDSSGNAPENVEIWELPTLLPGQNLIHQSSSDVKINLRFYPRYM